MIQIDIEIGIIEIRVTLEGLVAEVVTIAMLLFRTLNRPIILDMIRLAATVMHLRTKNFEESASEWKRRLIEWKIRYGENGIFYLMIFHHHLVQNSFLLAIQVEF